MSRCCVSTYIWRVSGAVNAGNGAGGAGAQDLLRVEAALGEVPLHRGHVHALADLRVHPRWAVIAVPQAAMDMAAMQDQQTKEGEKEKGKGKGKVRVTVEEMERVEVPALVVAQAKTDGTEIVPDMVAAQDPVDHGTEEL